jgi:hypothetical protein
LYDSTISSVAILAQDLYVKLSLFVYCMDECAALCSDEEIFAAAGTVPPNRKRHRSANGYPSSDVAYRRRRTAATRFEDACFTGPIVIVALIASAAGSWSHEVCDGSHPLGNWVIDKFNEVGSDPDVCEFLRDDHLLGFAAIESFRLLPPRAPLTTHSRSLSEELEPIYRNTLDAQYRRAKFKGTAAAEFLDCAFYNDPIKLNPLHAKLSDREFASFLEAEIYPSYNVINRTPVITPSHPVFSIHGVEETTVSNLFAIWSAVQSIFCECEAIEQGL